jgi:Fic family protein
MDGNGRIGRFLMNLMLASGGYRWTVIRSDRPRRDKYMQALEQASTEHNIVDFSEFIAEEMAVDWTVV